MQEMLETFLDYRFLFDIAVILLSTKLCGMLTRRFYMPQVVGALLAGLLLGPAILQPLFGFSVLEETDFIDSISEIGVIVLMFTAGLDTNIKDLKKVGVSSTIVAAIGVVVPLLMGWGIAAIFGAGENTLQHVFIGVILTATSVSITVETLKELGKLNTKVANTILGAAVIDDILGIIVLTVISSMADSSVSIWVTLLKILLFFVFVGVCAFLGYHLFSRWFSRSSKDLRRHVIVSFVFCLLMSLAAEVFFGVADITGAFFAGLILSSTTAQPYLNARFGTLSYMFLSPVFFASIGLKVSVEGMGATVWIFAGALVLVAILSKIVGCYIGARVCKFNHREGMQIGTGMVSRGEVALIVANKGYALGLMSDIYFAPVILVVIVTTIVSPILLKIAYREKKPKKEQPQLQS